MVVGLVLVLAEPGLEIQEQMVQQTLVVGAVHLEMVSREVLEGLVL